MLRATDITGEAFHHTVEDVDLLQRIVASLPRDSVVVNIGACFGTSALAMLEARKDVFVFSVNVGACPREEEHIKQAGLWEEHRLVRLLGRSQDIGMHWPHKVNFVFIDGGHSYDDVAGDIRAWIPKVRKGGGIVAFHDYGRPSLPGVKRAIDEAMSGARVAAHEDTIVVYIL